ncbi:Uncharacterised protein [Mycobacteroides abscessus subsp. bolletii]|nr:Uncharacterised protein [Mycobacteroides abscessus subsp. bolletii]
MSLAASSIEMGPPPAYPGMPVRIRRKLADGTQPRFMALMSGMLSRVDCAVLIDSRLDTLMKPPAPPPITRARMESLVPVPGPLMTPRLSTCPPEARPGTCPARVAALNTPCNPGGKIAPSELASLRSMGRVAVVLLTLYTRSLKRFCASSVAAVTLTIPPGSCVTVYPSSSSFFFVSSYFAGSTLRSIDLLLGTDTMAAPSSLKRAAPSSVGFHNPYWACAMSRNDCAPLSVSRRCSLTF